MGDFTALVRRLMDLADALRAYLGHDREPMPYPLALGPAK